MNDRFKFRVWDKGNEHYVDCADMLYIEPSGEITYACYDGDREDMYYYEQNDVVVEQCTGLRDKNGKLIYEGDIVGNEKYVHEIVWRDKDASFHTKLKGMEFICGHLEQSWIDEFGFKIIGNIHENPELLEQSNDD